MNLILMNIHNIPYFTERCGKIVVDFKLLVLETIISDTSQYI